MESMKQLYILSFAVFFSLTVAGQSTFNLDGDNTKLPSDKNISSVTVLKYSNGDAKNFNKEVRVYDNEGKQLKEMVYHANSSSVASEVEYEYDHKSRLLAVNSVSSGKKKVVTAYNYDDEQQVVEKKEFMYLNESADPLTYISRYEYLKDTLLGKLEIAAPSHTVVYYCEYNGKDQKTKELYTNSAGETLYSVKLAYDAKGNVIRKVRYNGYNEMEQETTCEYDAEGNLVVSIEYDNRGNEAKRREFTYEKGLMTGYKIVAKDKVVATIIKKYDANGNLIYDSQKREYYVYNDQNLLIEKGKTTGDGRIPLEQYSYAFFSK